MTRVLVVDDKPENLYLLRALLQGHDCNVDEARHGAEALVKARQSPPDLVISDLLMPVMDGYTLLRQWKADERLRQIPFVVYTATYTEPKDERLALDLGADAFIVKPAEPEPFMARIREVMEKKRRGELSTAQLPRAGEKVLLKEYSETLVRKLEGKALQLEQTNRALQEDIVRRQQAEVALHERDEILRLFVEHSPAAIGMFDNEMRYVAVSRRWLSDYGLGERDIVGRSHYEIFPEIPQRWKDIHRRCLAGATERCDEDPFVHADGRTDWVRWEIHPWHRAAGEIGGIIIFSEVITDRKLAEEALRGAHTRLEQLSRRLLAAQETERRNIARELHDEIGQLLTAVKLDLQMVMRECPGPAAYSCVREAMGSMDRVIARVRDLSLDLRPSMLDDLGLMPALRWMAGRQAERAGFAVHVGADLPDTRLAPEIETACFRIAQEALTNAARHARAKRVTVELRREGEALALTVRDDGCGFDAGAMRRQAAAGASFGLLGMQERATLAGGELEIESAPGRGTTVSARLPWRAAGGAA